MTQDGSSPKPLFAFIDCVRGYAVLLVITCHLTGAYAGLPWPVRRFATLGWHGVQLFFLASAVTLLMSWNHEKSRLGKADTRAFFIRRLLRIAPAYYVAALLYTIAWPPEQPSLLALVTTLAFVNVWHPVTIGSIPGSWTVVPGGWSVAVEFTFYFLFPLLAIWVRTPRRALGFLALTIAIALIANPLARAALQDHYPPVAIQNFLYFWPPNQMPVFAMGMLLYFLVHDVMGPNRFNLRSVLAPNGLIFAALAVMLFCSITFLPLPHSITPAFPAPPAFLLASAAFMLFILALAAAPRCLLVNRFAQAMGKVSFSAYLVHFAVLRLLPDALPKIFHTDARDYAAIVAFAAAWVAIVGVTYAVSWCTYHAIEQPMIRLARRQTAHEPRQQTGGVTA